VRPAGPPWWSGYPPGTDIERWRPHRLAVGLLTFALAIPLAVIAYAVAGVYLAALVPPALFAAAWAAERLVARLPDHVFLVRRPSG
jgi:hypothetical protein